MWREPSIFLTSTIELVWKAAVESQMWLAQMQHYQGISPDDVIDEVWLLYRDLNEHLVKSLPDARLSKKTRSSIYTRLVKMAKQIEDSGDYLRLYQWLMIAEEAWHLDPRIEPLMAMVEAIRTLTGSETKYLIGVRNGQPAWKHFSRPIGRSSHDAIELSIYGENHRLDVIDQSDAPLFPNFGESMLNLGDYAWPAVDRAKLQQLAEDAYYNQRYIVHPEGAYVRLRHFGAIKGMTIKVKRGMVDPGYVDIIATLEVNAHEIDSRYNSDPDGFLRKAVIVVDGAYLTRQWDYEEHLPVAGYEYLCSVATMIYHDLVTAETITVSPATSGIQSVWPSDLELPNPSWVYIPRKLKTGIVEPRVPMSSPRMLMPHHVTGHKRRGNMTEDHRLELIKLEQETGLEILRFVPQGYTFVRPHVSPSVEGLDELPRFIHARLQADIRRMLSPNSVTDQVHQTTTT